MSTCPPSSCSGNLPRTMLLAAIGIVTILGILISFSYQMSTPLYTAQFDSVRKELLETQQKPGGPRAPGQPLNEEALAAVSYRKTTCRSSAWGPEWTVDSNGGVCKHGEIGSNGCCPPPALPIDVRQLPMTTKPIDTRRSPLSIQTEPDTPATDDSTKTNPPQRRIADPAPSAPQIESPPQPATDNQASFPIRPSCSAQHQCCGQYEYCVSACLDFTWQRLHRVKLHTNSARSAQDKSIDSVQRLVGDHQAEDSIVATEYEKGTQDLFDWCLTRCRTSGRSVVHQNSFRSSLKYCYGLKDPPLLARNIQIGESD